MTNADVESSVRHTIIERGRAVWTGNSRDLVSAADIQHRFLGI